MFRSSCLPQTMNNKVELSLTRMDFLKPRFLDDGWYTRLQLDSALFKKLCLFVISNQKKNWYWKQKIAVFLQKYNQV